jgi:hypothetical protein
MNAHQWSIEYASFAMPVEIYTNIIIDILSLLRKPERMECIAYQYCKGQPE